MSQTELLKNISELVAFQTTNDNPQEITRCFDYIDEQLGFFPFVKKTIIHNGVESRIWSTVEGKHSKYILNAHIDVVPGSSSLFVMKETTDKILGRGVSDMKYSVAIFIAVLKQIFDENNTLPSLAIILTSDEERGGMNGVGHLVDDLGYSADLVFVPDGGENLKIVEEAKGVVQCSVSTQGKGAHAARLWEGVSAIDELIKVSIFLREKYPFPAQPVWGTTINYGQIHGGSQTNQVADKATLFLDVRYTPDIQPHVIFDQLKVRFPGAELETLVAADAFHIDRNNLYIQRWNELLTGGSDDAFIRENSASDGRYFTAKNMPVIVSKPEGGLIHTEDEWTSITSLMHFSECLRQLLLSHI